jgi:hypothetical protein
MRNALQRAWKLAAALVVVCAFIPAGKAEAAGACGYVRVQAVTVPLLTLCGPGDCNGPAPAINLPEDLGEVYVCITAV